MSRLRRALGSPRVVWLSVLLGVVLTVLSVWGGLFFDDYILRLACLGHPDIPYTPVSPLNLFSFITGKPEIQHAVVDRFLGVWGLTEDFQISFMRPLSSLTHAADFRLWPDSPAWMHVQSVLWYAFLVYFVSRFYRRILGPTWVAGLAMILFAVDDAHGTTVGWISNRNALIAGVFGVGALLAHDRWRRDGWRPGRWLGPVLLLGSLLGAESGVSVGAYLAAYAICLEDAPWRERLVSLLPYAVVVLVWRVVYSQLGYGVAGTDLYIDPLEEPMVFLAAARERLPAFVLGQFGLPPSETWILVSERGRMILTVLGSGLMAAIVLLTYPLARENRESRFFGLGALMAMVPLCATYPFDRLLIFVGIGAMGLVASFIAFLPNVKLDTMGARRWGSRALIGTWILLHGAVAPVLLPLRAFYPSKLDGIMARIGRTLPQDGALSDQTLVVVNTPDFSWSFYLLARRAALGEPLPGLIRFLSITEAEIVVVRDDARTLSLRWREGVLSRPMDRMFRGMRYPFVVGEAFQLAGLAVSVRGVTEDGRPTSVRFRFSVPLEDGSFRWVCWGKRGFEPFIPPAVGKSVTLGPVDPLDILAFGS